jgi:hypothetical protein
VAWGWDRAWAFSRCVAPDAQQDAAHFAYESRHRALSGGSVDGDERGFQFGDEVRQGTPVGLARNCGERWRRRAACSQERPQEHAHRERRVAPSRDSGVHNRQDAILGENNVRRIDRAIARFGLPRQLECDVAAELRRERRALLGDDSDDLSERDRCVDATRLDATRNWSGFERACHA